MKIGRNEACPCGSGMKYKKCCADKKENEGTHGGASLMDELEELLKGQQFASLEEANAFAAQLMQNRNTAGIDDFEGLSPGQMHRFLYFPFDTPNLITFADRLGSAPAAPIATLFGLLFEGLGEKGLKATATGNLPRQFCIDAALAYMGEEKYEEFTSIGKIRSEMDFGELHVARLVAGLAGLVRKYKGSFIPTKECKKLMAGDGMAAVYPRLFLAFVKNYNWGYQDGYQELPFIQQSFLFTLYLLQKHGAEWQSQTFYEDRFLRAFPTLVEEVEGNAYSTPETTIRHCYSLRALNRFAQYLGLVEIEHDPNNRLLGEFRLRKRPLLDQAVQFRL